LVGAKKIRKIILEQSKRADVGHIGCALSVADIMAALYGSVLKIKNPEDDKRDRFILSKGHAALALYAALFLKGWLNEKAIYSYCADNTALGVHPVHTLRGVDFSSGSLGHGLPFGVGCALAAKMKKQSYRTFVLISDAELNEGSVWESLMFASHHRLSNLIVVVDLNGQQAMGYTKKVLDLNPLNEKLRAFGWDTHTVDGHNVRAIADTVNKLNFKNGSPHVIIAKTVFGKGVSFMENKIKWHYWPMSDVEYQSALKEIKKG
jgi:transketolase